jgi:hypothetical protein
MTTYEMRIWEQAVMTALQGEYFKATTQEAEDVCNTIRGLIKGKIKITPEPEIVVEVEFPALLVPTRSKMPRSFLGVRLRPISTKNMKPSRLSRKSRLSRLIGLIKLIVQCPTKNFDKWILQLEDQPKDEPLDRRTATSIHPWGN